MSSFSVGEGNFRLDHPELGGVAGGVGGFGAEGRAEGVDVAEGHERSISAFSWPETVREAGFPKKSLLKSTLPSSVMGSASGSSVVTRNISPAPSQSLPVMRGVWT